MNKIYSTYKFLLLFGKKWDLFQSQIFSKILR